MKKLVFGIWALCLQAVLAQQPEFSFKPVQYSDSTVWYIHNHSQRWVKPTSLTLNWYHQKQSLVIWPYKYEPGYFLNTQKENYAGRNWVWKYKSSHGLSISDTIFPGDSLAVLISVNYNTAASDTVMPANLMLYFKDSIARGQTARIVPGGSHCVYQPLFLSSYWDKAGIKYGSHYNPSLHEGSCLNAGDWGSTYLIVFNEQTLKPSLAGMMFPRCESGRLWSTFGYAKDSQLFYSFNMSETGYFDSLIEAISPGDYVAMVSYAGATWSAVHGPSLAKLGFDVDRAATMQHVLLGRKGLPLDKAHYVGFGAPMASLKWVGMDHVLIPEQGGDSLKAYPDCFESLVRVHEPYIPEVKDTSSNRIHEVSALAWTLFPNPSSGRIHVQAPGDVVSIEVYSAQGQRLRLLEGSALGYWDLDLPGGYYLLQAQLQDGRRLSPKALLIQQ